MTSVASVYRAERLRQVQAYLETQANRPQALLVAAIFISVLLWASSFPAIQVSLTAYTPAEVAFLRYLVASAMLGGYAIVTRMPMPRPRDLPLISICGFLGFTVYNFMLNVGQLTVSAGIASFIISSEVGAMAILSQLFFKERLSKTGWIGVFLCTFGIAIISLTDGGSIQLSMGAVFVFGATLAASLYSVLQKPLLERYTAVQFTTYAAFAGTICLFFFAPRAVFSVLGAPLYPTLSVVYMGLFPGVVAYVAWSYVLSKLPTAQAGSYLALVPVAALLIAWIWLREIPTPISLIGGAIVFFGVMLINQIDRKAVTL